jgi:hypothetical protein
MAGLERLPAAETVRYVNHRLQVAGYDASELFTPGALALIAERSEGIPRNINNICFNAMSLGLVMRRKKIEARVVQEALDDSSLESLVPQRKMAPAAAPAVRDVTQIYYSWIKDNLFGRRAHLTTALAALLVCLAIYVGTRSGASTTHSSSEAIHHDSSSVKATSSAEPLSASGQSPTPAPTKPDADAAGSLTYVVQPSDTLRDLCLSIVGRYDDAVLAKIRELNPDLKDPNRLEVGQEVRLPLSLPD